MPYIVETARELLDDGGLPDNAGEMNYVISTLIDDYLQEYGKYYANINEVIGVLECAKLELYRRIAAPYEDEKIETNGDVYDVIKIA